MGRFIAAIVVLFFTLSCTADGPHSEEDDDDRAYVLRSSSAPTQWLTSGGLSYRRATSQELARNDWAPGSYLVERHATAGLRYGQNSATVLLPRGDGDTEALTLIRVTNAQSGSFGTISYTTSMSHHAETVLFDTFEKEDENGEHYGRVVIADNDSLYGLVKNSSNETFEILQLQSRHYIDTALAPPMAAGDSIVVSPLGEIPPGPGHKIPNTGTITRLSYMGEGIFCMNHVDDWKAILHYHGQTVRTVHFNSATGGDLQLVFSTCHFFDSIDQAMTCSKTGGGGATPSYCYDAEGHLYPFRDTMNLSGLFYLYDLRDVAWDTVDHADLHLAMPDIELVQVRTGALIYDPSNLETTQGIGDGPNTDPMVGWSELRGRSVASSGTELGGLVSAHKFSHNFVGPEHDGEELMGQYSHTLMWEIVLHTTAPWFSAANAEAAVDCVDSTSCPVGAAWSSP
ncbi:hypothetical protein ENSA5_37050 [Enhygromyxa salina]|uniref:Uncharacterized protein n=1 Tax=Enhygromyxa salina TaxID=215803 RepID=A0A2S9XSL5_9BACT|nr:hypothetical protein [Enhygromyxa salina]PRP95836.1 hypothetical protein ENSA5_37050 [Enhygromyxa salina]